MKNMMIVLSLIWIAGCSNPVDVPAGYDPQSVKDEARAALIAYGEALSSGDIEKAAEYYDRDADFHWIERGGVQYESGDEAAASLKALIVPGATAKLTFDDIRIADLGPTAALASAYFTYEMDYENDQQDFSFGGWMSVALTKRAQGWRFAAGQVGPGPANRSNSN
ncbi:MAG: hypothetical protein DHS20C05_04110 [Hyphococcus sp.]|nr:MAG: hypothetical protein DHS20C05_04110 [Marinicaulis sp.]